jgi:Transposase DDE domain
MDNLSDVVKEIKQNLSANIFDETARNTKLIERSRKCEGHALFWSIVGGFCVGQATEIAGMQRAFSKDTGIQINYSAWHGRLCKDGFPAFMRQNVTHLINHFYTEHLTVKGKLLKQFRDIHMQDGSSFGINDLLSKWYPGRFTKISPAAVELHVLYSLRCGAPVTIGLAPDRVSEYEFMPTGEYADLKDTLNLFDRGYGSLKRLHVIEDEDGYFITRMKDNINPTIVAVHKSDGRLKHYFKDKLFQEVKLKKKQDYDFTVQFRDDNIFRCLRVIALWNPRTKKHVIFLTNTSAQQLSAKTVGKLYRLRWQIELLFKELKSHTELRKFLTANANIAEGFIWAAFCALFIRRFLVSTAQKISGQRLSFHKAAISARNFIPEFIACALKKFAGLKQYLLDAFTYIQSTMFFSNPQRQSALQLAGIIA